MNAALLLLGLASASERSAKLAKSANDAWLGGDAKRAERLADRAVAADPADVEALWVRFNVSISQWNHVPEESREEYVRSLNMDANRILELAPESNHAAIVRRLADEWSGVALIPEPVYACSNSARSAIQRAEEAFARHDLETARVAYDEALRECDQNAIWWTYSGDAFFGMNDYGGAAARYQAALDREPCYWVAHRFLADARFRQGDLAGGMGAAVRAVSCNPEYAYGWDYLAETLTRLHLPPMLPRITRRVDPIGWSQYDELLVATTGPVDAVERRRAVVLEALSAGKTGMLWDALRTANDESLLDAAIYVHLFDKELVEGFLRYRDEHRQELDTYILQHMLVRSP